MAAEELVDDDGYFDDFEAYDKIRKSTEEFLKMKRDEFWAVHKESIEEQKIINEAAEYYDQLKFAREIEAERIVQNLQMEHESKVRSIHSSFLSLAMGVQSQLVGDETMDAEKKQLVQQQLQQIEQQYSSQIFLVQQQFVCSSSSSNHSDSLYNRAHQTPMCHRQYLR